MPEPAWAAHDEAAAAQAPPAPPEPESNARLWALPQGFAANLLVLNWADMLLRRAPSRDAIVDVVGYYHNIGWIGDVARDQLLAYADGLQWQGAGGQADWRADVGLHEKSLLYVEKLRALQGRRD